MGLRIATNTTALSAHRQLANTRMNLDKSLERLSSGSRINNAGDDAAGLAISENLRGQIRGVRQARRREPRDRPPAGGDTARQRRPRSRQDCRGSTTPRPERSSPSSDCGDAHALHRHPSHACSRVRSQRRASAGRNILAATRAALRIPVAGSSFASSPLTTRSRSAACTPRLPMYRDIHPRKARRASSRRPVRKATAQHESG